MSLFFRNKCNVCQLKEIHWHCEYCKNVQINYWSSRRNCCDLCAGEKTARIKLGRVKRDIKEKIKNIENKNIKEFLKSSNINAKAFYGTKEDINMIIEYYFDSKKILPLIHVNNHGKIDINKTRKRKIFDELEENYIKLLKKQNKLLSKNIWYYETKYNNIEINIQEKYKLLNTKLIYKKYKGEYLVDKFLNNPDYIQWLISHGWELDTNKDYNGYGYSQKVIKKQNKIESEFTKIFRYILNIPKYPCDKSNCKKYAMYGIDKNKPFRCTKHKIFSHKIVIQTDCRGVNDVCPYGCKKGNINYDNYCTYCFCHLFPNDKRTKNIRSKSKEIEVINHICLTHVGKWYHDKPLYVNYENICCPSKRRIDLRQLIGNTMLCIEVDENQHKYYTTNDDFIRYNELLCDLTCKYIFIRYNPDKYKKNSKVYNPNIKKRLEKLDRQIIKQIKRIKENKNKDLLEIIHLFYDK